MKTAKNEFLTQAFVLTSSEVTKLYALFPNGADTSLEIVCTDGVERKYDSLEEFLSFEHPPDKQITRLVIRSYSNHVKDTTSVYFDNHQPPRHNISSLSSGDESYVTDVSTRLGDRFSAMKPWYWWIAKNGWFVLLILWISGWVGTTGRNLASSSYSVSSLLSDIKNASVGAVFLFLLVCIIVVPIGIWLFNTLQRFINYVFPMGVFAIGQGTKRHNDKEKWRTLVIVGFVVNILAGFVVWIATR